MARRVFFSFHYDRDVWRANQVRNCNVVAGTEAAGFFDHSEYEEAERQGLPGIRRMIQSHLEGTTVTVVLIGKKTAERPWVRYEIAQSVARQNGMLGIHIYHLKDQDGDSALWEGKKPEVPGYIPFPTYEWDKDVDRFRRSIEDAARRAESWRTTGDPDPERLLEEWFA
jgi:hypothetical protein